MEKLQIPKNINNLVYNKFRDLLLKHKLIVYSKLVHGNSFKPQNSDLFNLNRRIISKIFRSFIESIKEENNERS
jgi:hypothetical protein